MAKIITIANQKGGVGKTTTALCLGAILEDKGYKVLYIDLDKQCNTSKTLKADVNKKGVYEILAEKEKAQNVIQETSNKEYVITANGNLNNIDNILNSNEIIRKEYRLKDSLADVKNDFDFIIIDTPPNINNAIINALTTTDYLIIISNADSFSIDGINYLLSMSKQVKDGTNKDLKIGGILITRYNGRAVISRDYKDILDEIAQNNNTKIYNSIIRECIAIRESQALKENIVKYARNSNAVIDYQAFTEELLNDIKKEG